MIAPRLELLGVRSDDAPALLEFELSNKDWFERFVPPRPEGFLTPEGMVRAVDMLVAEMAAGEGAYYLAWAGETVVARFNFSRIDGEIADVGYRVGANNAGRGLATAQLKKAIERAAVQLRIKRFTAEASPSNPASIRVLVKCGFVRSGRIELRAKLNGVDIDLWQYACELE